MRTQPVSFNKAAQSPMSELTGAERDGLFAISTYRRQAWRETGIAIGPRIFSRTTIRNLHRKGLICGDVPKLKPTTAGSLALVRMAFAGEKAARSS